MPFTDITSYPVAGREFEGFWNTLNAAFVGQKRPALTLPGNYAVANLTGDIAGVAAAIAAVNAQQTVVDTAANQIKIFKGPVIERFKQLRRAFDAFLVGTKYAGTLPLTPKLDSAAPNWNRPLEDAAKLWGDANTDPALPGVTQPLTLAGGYTLAQFQADSTALTDAIQVRASIPTTLDPLINARNAQMKALLDRCVQLRAAVESQLDSNDPLLQSLPAVTPPKKQSVASVTLSLFVDPNTGDHILSWTKPDAHTARVSIRTCSGTKYKEAASHAVADVEPSVLSWTIPTDLRPTGQTTWFKAVCVSDSEHTASSNAVKG